MIIYQTWSFYFLSSIYQLDDAGDHLETQLNRKAPSLVNDLGVYFWPLVIDHSHPWHNLTLKRHPKIEKKNISQHNVKNPGNGISIAYLWQFHTHLRKFGSVSLSNFSPFQSSLNYLLYQGECARVLSKKWLEGG